MIDSDRVDLNQSKCFCSSSGSNFLFFPKICGSIVSDELAKRIQPIGPWLPTVIELSLIGFETLATATATEVIQFLSEDRFPQDVLDYHVSEQAQKRLQRLLALTNEAGMLPETEQRELDELQQIEHIVIMLKAQVERREIRQSGVAT